MEIIEKARIYAINCHRSTNHSYDGKPYEEHLTMVYNEALQFIELVPAHQRNTFLAGAWVHDVIEDCRQTYNDVAKATNNEVADLAYALTNEKGRNRKERANGKYYKELRYVDNAVLLKICDRIANIKYSILSKSRMAEMYARENEDFVFNIDDGKCGPAIDFLNKLCEQIRLTQRP